MSKAFILKIYTLHVTNVLRRPDYVSFHSGNSTTSGISKIYFGLFFFLLCLLLSPVYGQTGKDGKKIIVLPNTIVNEFTPLKINGNIGDNTITVANAALNANGRFAGSLAVGDLLMIVQMQGASINGAPADSSWGVITNYNNCGLYEFQQVYAILNDTTIELDCGLQYNYTASGNTQAIRVPRYSSLRIDSGGVLTTDAWNGSVGGVLMVEVVDSTIVNTGGSISATGMGFRGGATENVSTHPGSMGYASTDSIDGGEKGESIAGYKRDYDIYGGAFSRGAPANGGGGGNSHNAGGGGGANAGIIPAYTGNGNPDNSNPAWTAAWNMEYNGFANSTSSGGGKGGDTYGSTNQDALTLAPGDTLWGGDNRQKTGGKGGRPLDYSTGRLFLGGGGGAGDANNGCVGGSGRGGGLIYILSYGTISGNGSVTSHGADASNTTGAGIDASGGGGGGGTIILNAIISISGVSAAANGGKGGDQIYFGKNPFESEGPGGGGGGGYIAISNGAISRTASFGNNGITTSPGVNEFPVNGATRGGAGFPNEKITNFFVLTVNDTVCPSEKALLSASIKGSPFPNTSIYWYDAIVGGNVLGSGPAFTTPPLTKTTTYFVGTCPGWKRDIAVASVRPSSAANFTAPPVCMDNNSVFTQINPGGAVNREWDFGDGSPMDTSSHPLHKYKTAGIFMASLKVKTAFGCTYILTDTVVVNALPTAMFTAPGVCLNNTTILTDASLPARTIVFWEWTFGDGTPVNRTQNPSHKYGSSGTFGTTLKVKNLQGCSDSYTADVFVYPLPVANFVTNSQGEDFANHIVNFLDRSSGATSWNWNFGDGDSLENSEQNITHAYPQDIADNYNIKLSIQNKYGCKANIEKPVYLPLFRFYIPNAFTPNTDDLNDVFNGKGIGIIEYELWIYDRWGEKIFYSNDLSIGWNGFVKNQLAQEDVYVWLVVLKDVFEIKHRYMGRVTLVR